MAAADQSVGPGSFAAALVLHLALFAALMLAVKPNVIPTGAAVPITLVSDAPSQSAKAEPSPTPRAAQTEEPTPRSPPPEPAPPPRGAPTPPRPAPPKPPPSRPAPSRPPPTPTPKPTPKTVAKPTEIAPPVKPNRAPPAPVKSSLDLDALQMSLAHSTHAAPPRPSFAERGPTRAQAAQRTAAAGISREEQAGLSQLLNRLWNPNCSIEGGDAVLVSVGFTVGYDGRLSGRVNAGGRESSPDAVVATAARRAIDAVHAAEPYQATYRGAQFRINFDAKKACANR